MISIDLIAGLGAVAYAITTGVLAATGVVDLGEYVCQPIPAGAFGFVALRRWYNNNRTKLKQEEASE